MAIKRSRRMVIVLQMAEREEDTAARQLQQSRNQVAQAEQQLQQIEEYQQGYTQALNQPKAGVSAYAMINDRRFLQQLHVVCQSQMAQIRQLRDQEARCLSQWQQSYQRRRNIEQLITRLKQDENALLEKQLQKELDELSSVFLARERHHD